MQKPARSFLALAILGMALAGCDGGNGEKNLASLDAELTNNSMDPALREVVEGPLATDPGLSGDANRDAVRPSDKPLTGAVPANLSPREAREQAVKLAGGKLLSTPAATKSVTSTDQPATLGGMAKKKQGGGKCGPARMNYDMQWAARMPAALPVYPGGNVTEAAGTDTPCAIRAVSFTTAIPQQEVMDFYYTMTRRSGYTAEHIEENGEHVLGGTRAKDDGAYYVSMTSAPGGGTSVTLIANGGR